jgi:hypothetical protein
MNNQLALSLSTLGCEQAVFTFPVVFPSMLGRPLVVVVSWADFMYFVHSLFK